MKSIFKKTLGLALALVLVLSTVSGSVLLTYGEENRNTPTVTKTLEWGKDDKGNTDKSKAVINITTSVPKPDDLAPDVLFIGSLCSSHGMSGGSTTQADTVRSSVNSLAKTCNVTYYAVNNRSKTSLCAYSGSLKKGQSISSNMSYSGGNHSGLGHFAQLLKKELITDKKSYDFIILEFDSARLAAAYQYSDLGVTTQAQEAAMLTEVATVLKKYYDNKQVVWVTDNTSLSNETTGKYDWANVAPNNVYDTGGKLYKLDQSCFKALAALMDPSTYLKWSTKFPSWTDNTRYSLTDIATGYKTDYSQKDKLDKFMEDFLVYTIDMELSDKIKMPSHLTITGAKLTATKDKTLSTTTAWVDYTTVDTAAAPAIDAKENTVTASAKRVDTDVWMYMNLRIDITADDKFESIFEYDKDNKVFINPNDGPGKLEIEYPTPDGKKQIKKEDTPDVPLYPDVYVITTTVTNGTLSPSGNQTVIKGNSKKFTYSANKGYALISVKVDDVEQGTTSYPDSYTFSNVQKNHTLAVTYGKISTIKYAYIGTVPAGAAGVPADADGIETKEYSVESAPSLKGYSFSGWTTTDATVEKGKFTMPAKEVKFTGYWTEDADVEIIYKSNDTKMGEVKPLGETVAPATGNAGGSVATANRGYKFVNWTDSQGKIVSTNAVYIPAKVGGLNVPGTYTANFAIKEFKILYELEGGENNPENLARYNVETGEITFKEPTKEGFNFLYWVDEQGNKITEWDVDKLTDVKLTAVWEPAMGDNSNVGIYVAAMVLAACGAAAVCLLPKKKHI